MQPQLPLHDIVEHPDVSWWPLPWGTWALIVGLLALALYVLYRLRRQHLRSRSKREGLARLALPTDSLSAVNLSVKQVALAYFPRQQVADLHGSAWLAFLVRTMPAPHDVIFSQHIERYKQQLYQPAQAEDVQAYQQLLRQWVKHALPPPPGVQQEAHNV